MIHEEIIEVHIPIYISDIQQVNCKFSRTPVYSIGLNPLSIFKDAYDFSGEYRRHAFGACCHNKHEVPIYA